MRKWVVLVLVFLLCEGPLAQVNEATQAPDQPHTNANTDAALRPTLTTASGPLLRSILTHPNLSPQPPTPSLNATLVVEGLRGLVGVVADGLRGAGRGETGLVNAAASALLQLRHGEDQNTVASSYAGTLIAFYLALRVLWYFVPHTLTAFQPWSTNRAWLDAMVWLCGLTLALGYIPGPFAHFALPLAMLAFVVAVVMVLRVVVFRTGHLCGFDDAVSYWTLSVRSPLTKELVVQNVLASTTHGETNIKFHASDGAHFDMTFTPDVGKPPHQHSVLSAVVNAIVRPLEYHQRGGVQRLAFISCDEFVGREGGIVLHGVRITRSAYQSDHSPRKLVKHLRASSGDSLVSELRNANKLTHEQVLRAVREFAVILKDVSKRGRMPLEWRKSEQELRHLDKDELVGMVRSLVQRPRMFASEKSAMHPVEQGVWQVYCEYNPGITFTRDAKAMLKSDERDEVMVSLARPILSILDLNPLEELTTSLHTRESGDKLPPGVESVSDVVVGKVATTFTTRLLVKFETGTGFLARKLCDDLVAHDD